MEGRVYEGRILEDEDGRRMEVRPCNHMRATAQARGRGEKA